MEFARIGTSENADYGAETAEKVRVSTRFAKGGGGDSGETGGVDGWGMDPDKPSNDMKHYLDDFFWRVSLSERYSSSVETKLAQDKKRVDQILNTQLPKYDLHIDYSKETIIEKGWFSANRSFIKAILCLMAYQQPKSFNDNSIVLMSNEWLKQANSRIRLLPFSHVHT